MSEENTGAEQADQQDTARDEAPKGRAFDLPPGLGAALLSSIGGHRSIHEVGVQGSVIEQTRSLLDEYMKPDPVDLTVPGIDETVPAIISKDGLEVLEPRLFDSWRTNPRYREGRATLLDLDSLIAHINRFSDADSLVFADNNRSAPTITAVLDYHHVGADSLARYGRHTSHFAFPLSDEWKAWVGGNGTPLSMQEFARFLEDHIIDVIPADQTELNPAQQQFVDTLGGMGRVASPAKLMELATGLQVFEESEVSQATRLATGESKLVLQSKHVDGQGGELKVPSMFVLGIPVFVNGPAYQILVRLRYRKSGTGIIFFYEMWRTDRVFDHAFTEATDRVKEETGLPVLLGKPEKA